jgi:hypothetical protein
MNKAAAAYLVLKYPDIVSVFYRKNGMTEVRLKRMDREVKTTTKTFRKRRENEGVIKRNMPRATRKRRV